MRAVKKLTVVVGIVAAGMLGFAVPAQAEINVDVGIGADVGTVVNSGFNVDATLPFPVDVGVGADVGVGVGVGQ